MSVLSVQVINLNFHHKNVNTAPNTHHLYLPQRFEQTEDPWFLEATINHFFLNYFPRIWNHSGKLSRLKWSVWRRLTLHTHPAYLFMLVNCLCAPCLTMSKVSRQQIYSFIAIVSLEKRFIPKLKFRYHLPTFMMFQTWMTLIFYHEIPKAMLLFFLK